jgi:hypothetical protein
MQIQYAKRKDQQIMIVRSIQVSNHFTGLLLLPAILLISIQASAQHSEHHQGLAPGNLEPSMSGGMMAQHEQMMNQHQEMMKLIDQLAKSFSSLENEKDATQLKKKLTEHGALLKELQVKIQQNGGMMGMQGQANPHSMMDMTHAEKGMGFSQTQTTHHFFLQKDGGVIQVEANDPKDTQNRDLIRTHLAQIAKAFAAGDFSSPMVVHDVAPDGVPVMQRLKGGIKYTFEQTSQGGRVHIHTANPEALEAIHQFIRFQIREHETGDSPNVK